MHFSTRLTVAALIAAPLAAAQANIPSCALAPAQALIMSSGFPCEISDVSCICKDQDFTSALQSMILSDCTGSDQSSAVAGANQLCNAFGATFTAAATSTPPSTSSSTAAVSTTSAGPGASSTASATAPASTAPFPSSTAAASSTDAPGSTDDEVTTTIIETISTTYCPESATATTAVAELTTTIVETLSTTYCPESASESASASGSGILSPSSILSLSTIISPSGVPLPSGNGTGVVSPSPSGSSLPFSNAAAAKGVNVLAVLAVLGAVVAL